MSELSRFVGAGMLSALTAGSLALAAPPRSRSRRCPGGPQTLPSLPCRTIPLSHTFQEPCTSTVIAPLRTTDCGSPYGNDLEIRHTVTVAPAVETG